MEIAETSKTLDGNIEEKKKIKKKKGKAILPVLASKATPYDIAEDLATMKANITVAQLIETSPAQRVKMSKAMR